MCQILSMKKPNFDCYSVYRFSTSNEDDKNGKHSSSQSSAFPLTKFGILVNMTILHSMKRSVNRQSVLLQRN